MDPIRGVADLASSKDWGEFQSGVVATLKDLEHGAIFTMQASGALNPAAPRRVDLPGPGNRLMRRRRTPVDPVLQFLRVANALYGECSGPVEDGGWTWLDPEQLAALAGLGWAQDQGKDREYWGYPNFCVYFPHEADTLSQRVQYAPSDYLREVDFDRAARLAVDTLREVHGVPSPGQLRIWRQN